MSAKITTHTYDASFPVKHTITISELIGSFLLPGTNLQ